MKRASSVYFPLSSLYLFPLFHSLIMHNLFSPYLQNPFPPYPSRYFYHHFPITPPQATPIFPSLFPTFFRFPFLFPLPWSPHPSHPLILKIRFPYSFPSISTPFTSRLPPQARLLLLLLSFPQYLLPFPITYTVPSLHS